MAKDRKSSWAPKAEATTEAEVTREEKKPAGRLIAKRDFVVSHNGYHRIINIGDDLSDIPEIYHANLKTEGVL